MAKNTLIYEALAPRRKGASRQAVTSIICGGVSFLFALVGPGFHVATPMGFPGNRWYRLIALSALTFVLFGFVFAVSSIVRYKRLEICAILGLLLSLLGSWFPVSVIATILHDHFN